MVNRPIVTLSALHSECGTSWPIADSRRYYEPPDSYESKHRWDPKATWTKEEEKKLVRKLDLRVAFVACICFAALQLDRGNLTNAVSDNLLKDIGLTTQHYNYGNTIFVSEWIHAKLTSSMLPSWLPSFRRKSVSERSTNPADITSIEETRLGCLDPYPDDVLVGRSHGSVWSERQDEFLRHSCSPWSP